MILSTGAVARALGWLILILCPLWVMTARLWIVGLTIPVMVILTTEPRRWLRWLLLTITSAGFFLLAIYLGAIMAQGIGWTFTEWEMDRAARLATAVGAALGLGEAMRDSRLQMALLWRLGGAMAALTWLGAPRQRELARQDALVRSTRGAPRMRWSESVRHLTARYWTYAPGTAITLTMRGWGAHKVHPPSFPYMRILDIPLLILIIAIAIFSSTI